MTSYRPTCGTRTAARLATAVHDGDPVEVERITKPLTRQQLRDLVIDCAALIDVNQSIADLLAWTEPHVQWTNRRLLDAHAAYERGDRDHWARSGEREYQRRSHLRRTGRAA